MKLLRPALGLLVVGALLVLAWRHFFPDETRRVRRTLTDLAATASVPAQVGPARMILALDKLKGFFSRDVEGVVDVPGGGRQTFEDREELIAAAAAMWSNWRNTKVEFLDINVKLDPAKENATAELTARVSLPGQRDFFVQEFKVQLQKQDNAWRVRRVETVRVLR